MENKKKSVQILEDLSWIAEKPTTKWWIWICFLVTVILVGLYALVIQIKEGHGVTGMRDHVIWGIYIANFIFFLGISYAGAVFASLFHLFQVPWRRPVIRIATLMAVIGIIVGPTYIFLCIGRLDRLGNLFLFPRLQSPIIWDVFAIASYFVAAVLLLYLGLIKDFAIFRDAKKIQFGKFRKRIYSILSINYSAKPEQDRIIRRMRTLLSLILVPLVVIIASILSWIFGMTLRPGWHSTIFGPYFVIAAIYSGCAAIILAMWLFRKIYHLDIYFSDKHFVYMGIVLVALGMGYGYFTFSEYLTGWYVSEKWDSEVLDKLLNRDHYGTWFLLSNVLGILVAPVVMAFKKLRKAGFITFAALLVVISMWIRRYLIVIPTLETPLIPIQDIRTEYINYSMTWVEIALTLGGLATFFLLFSLASQLITIIPMTEFTNEDKTTILTGSIQ